MEQLDLSGLESGVSEQGAHGTENRLFFEKDDDKALPEDTSQNDQHGGGKYDKDQLEGEGLVFDFDFARQKIDFCRLFHRAKQGNALFMRWGKMLFFSGRHFSLCFCGGQPGRPAGGRFSF